MPITKLSLGGINRFDKHLVRGQLGQTSAADLRDFLNVDSDDGSSSYLDYLSHHAGTKLLFQPVFKANETATEFENFGIHVSKTTGRVRVTGGAAPNPSPSSFMVEAVLTHDSGAQVPDPKPTAFIHVHVHQHVERVWFTPKRLSVRVAPGAGTPAYAFTVRAEFDDGTVADVTNSDQLTFTPASCFASGSWIHVPSSASAGDILPVKVRTSARWNNRTADGEIEVLPLWDTEPNPPTADLVDGKPDVWSGVIRPDGIPNVVFVPTGFTAGTELHRFEDIANLMVHKLKKDRMLQPFGYLGTAMNFWRVSLPSKDPGISIRFEVTTVTRDGQLFAEPVPQPLAYPPDLAQWLIEHLLYAVGMPVPADRNLIKDPENNQTPSLDDLRRRQPASFNFDLLFQKWSATARPVPGHPFATLNPATARDWVVLGDRTFIDEVNNFPPASLGDPPGSGTPPDTFSFHELRGGPDVREGFFRRVGATAKLGFPPILLEGPEPNNKLGYLWVDDPATRPGFGFDNRRLITWVSNIPYGRENATIFARLALRRRNAAGEKVTLLGLPVVRVAGRNALTLALPAIDMELVGPGTWQSFSHELAHGLGLGDEYMNFERDSPYSEQQLAQWPNLSTVSDSVAVVDNVVQVDRIKWNWHRVRRASILTRPIKPLPQPDPEVPTRDFHVYVGLARAFQFAPGDKLLLRKRERLKVLGRGLTISASELTVKSIHKTNIDDPTDLRNMTIVVEGDKSLNVAPYGIGSLIYQPVPAPAGVTPARPYLTLVPPAAERIMNAIGGTLSGKDCDLFFAGIIPTPQLPDPANKVPSIHLTRLVGLFFGGALYSCGIVHPVGMCLMRNSGHRPEIPDEGEPAPSPEALRGVSALCPVCRFALVDFVDPEQHFLNDLDYDKWYPF